ncbi:MAG: YdbL family protein [Brevundimonas sp.]|uniref:YdbL family protein n=2 Tax=Brevundimonas sp. TaxID=1871086 RepID=UPI0027F151A8|nr:YdbL family protein [Brevundimonas sp.]MDI6624402.1 YdbL family protein [Brevundimonas sp.]MDQ7813176.1 YdbL family protein [Brevundimonas sp.]
MRKSPPMSFRKLFVVAAAIAALGVAAGAAFAQTAQQKAMIDSAKAQGVVGEQADGYLGFRQPSSDSTLTEAVSVTNNARREAYARSAEVAGTTADVAAARAFETIVLPRVSSGQWYRNAQGRWVQR